MAIKFNRSQTFATNGTVTAPALHNLVDGLDIYQALITDQTNLTSVGTADELLIADADLTPNDAPRAVTVQELFNDALTVGTYTDANFTANLTYGTATGNRTVSTNASITTGTINNATLGTTTGTAATITNGTINNATLGTTTGTAATITNGTITTALIPTLTTGTTTSTNEVVTNFSATTSTFLGAITGSTNVVNIGSGQIYKDASGNVGIGVTPSAWGSSFVGLQVGGASSIWTDKTNGLRTFINTNTYFDGTNRKYLGNGAASEYLQGSDGSHVWYSAGSGTAGSNITMSPRLTIDSSGNVGIGTATSLVRLTVDSGSADQYGRFNSTAANGGYLTIESSGTVHGDIGTAAQVVTGGSASDFGINARGSRNLVIGTNNTERLRIDSSGFVSIGTATGLSALHVHGNVTLSNTTTATSAGTGGLSKPATYAGYLTVSINGTSRKIPYYAT